MKRLFSFFMILLIFNSTNSLAVAMSPQQQELYQAAIVELNPDKALELLQRNNINLNEYIEVNGRQTTFLHELLQLACDFHRFKTGDNKNITDDLDINLFSSPIGVQGDNSNCLNQKQIQERYKREINFDLDYSLYQMFRLF